MKCYIKSSSTFQTIAQRDTDGWDLCLDSLSGDSSTLTLLGEDSPSFLNGEWLIINDELLRIAEVAPNKGKTKLKLNPVDSFFSREILYQTTNAATIGAFISGLITSGWINQSDAVYAAPYITVTSTDTTPFVEPETDDDGIFNLMSYIRSVRANNNVVLHAAFSGNTLALTISKDTPLVRPLVLDDGHTQLISSDFSAKVLAKLTVFRPVDTGQVDSDNKPIMQTTETLYYLAADGTVSSTVPQNRAVGDWGAIHIAEDDDPDEKAAEAFAENEQARKIELFSDVQMSVGDKAKIRINGDVVESTVNGIYRKSGDLRTRYKIGELVTTVTEKLNALSSV